MKSIQRRFIIISVLFISALILTGCSLRPRGEEIAGLKNILLPKGWQMIEQKTDAQSVVADIRFLSSYDCPGDPNAAQTFDQSPFDEMFFLTFYNKLSQRELHNKETQYSECLEQKKNDSKTQCYNHTPQINTDRYSVLVEPHVCSDRTDSFRNEVEDYLKTFKTKIDVPSDKEMKRDVSKPKKDVAVTIPVKISMADSCANNGRTCYLRKAFEALDPAICKTMPQEDSTQQGDKAYCLGFMAYIKHDPSICQNPDMDPYFENACRTLLDERFFNQVLFTDLQYMFQHGIDPDIQPKMMAQVNAGEFGGKIKEKVSACGGDDGCYYDLADENRDARICDLMRDREYKGECYFNLAIYKPDPKLCPKIVDEKWRTPCFEKTATK